MKERFTLVLCASVQWDEHKRCITSMLMRRTGFLEIWILGGLVNRGRSWRGGERRKRYAELNCPCDGAPLSHNGAITLAFSKCKRGIVLSSSLPPSLARSRVSPAVHLRGRLLRHCSLKKERLSFNLQSSSCAPQCCVSPMGVRARSFALCDLCFRS